MEIEIKKFKRIEQTTVNLESLNVFIGSNNTGKSSFIQGIQFAISACQTLELNKSNWKTNGTRTLSLDSSEFLYTPTKNIESLYHGKKLTGSRTRDERSKIEFTFKDGLNKSTLTISKGKNGGFTTSLHGRNLGHALSDINIPFCVYVPGIAGIPTQEKYEVPIAVRKSATRGDSNNYLRNILYSINKNQKKWSSFLSSVRSIYKNVEISVDFNENKSEYIFVNVKMNSIEVPLDTIGTGLLQVIQIFAYIEYFNPQIILLDEPDAHIHPTKQRLLAEELAQKTVTNDKLKIVFSTHSRYILDALENRAKVSHFQDGVALSDVKNSSILIDIGAADAEYLFGNKRIKYVIATEDKVDNITEKKEFLKKFVIANGLHEEEIVFHSYEGCKNVHFAKILEGFVTKHIPGAKVILHIDRDQKADNDPDLIKLQENCRRDGIALFVTKFQEIESYFCTPGHISEIYNVPLPEATLQYEKLVNELETKTKEKLKDFILNERPLLGMNENKRFESKKVETQVNDWYQQYKYQFTLGKELLGKTKKFLQETLHKNPTEILQPSSHLKCDIFQETISQLSSN